MKSVVVIPTYNEAENITQLIPAVRAAMPSADILVVDDGSPDGTGDLAESMGAVVLRRSGKGGLGTAYVAGLTRVVAQGYERIAHMDADFSHDPSMLPRLIETLDEVDVAIGSRYVAGGGVENWPKRRKLLSWTANMVARNFLGLRTCDVTTGYRAYRREVLERINLPSVKSEGYSFMVELVYRSQKMGFSIGEVPILFRDRELGTSKMSVREMGQGLVNLWRIRFTS